MQNISQVHIKTEDKKKAVKAVNDEIKQVFNGNDSWKRIVSEIKELREKKKTIELSLLDEAEMAKLETLKMELKDLKQMRSDIAVSLLTAGATTTALDEHERPWEPKFKVEYKKK